MKMNDLQNGDKAEVTAVLAEGEIASRLVDMGLVKGTRFTLLRKAPLGDPLEIKIRGFLLTLRLKEAEYISVVKIGERGDGIPMKRNRFNFRGGRRDV